MIRYDLVKLKPAFQRFVLFWASAVFSIILFPSNSLAYELLPSKWPNPYTTFHVDISGGGGLWTNAFEEALGKWTSATDFTFYIEYDYADPCQDPNDVPPKNGVKFSSSVCDDEWGGHTLAITTSWTQDDNFVQSGTVFNSNEDWDVYSGPLEKPGYEGIIDFRRVAVHELGHSIGLDHEDDVPAIMNSYIGDNEDPLADDITGVNILYFGTSSITAESACAGKKILATSKSFKSLSKCYSKEIVKSDNIKFVSCTGKADAKMQTVWDKEEAKAAQKGYDCTTAESDDVYALIEDLFEDVDGQIRAGLDLNNSQASKLGSALLKAIGKYGSRLLKAEGANLKKPNQIKRSNSISKANDKFAALWNKSISKAQDKGVVYTGPSRADVEILITAIVMDVLTEME